MNDKWTVVYIANDDIHTIQVLGLFDSENDARKYVISDIECNKDTLVENKQYDKKEDIEVISYNNDYNIDGYGKWLIRKIDLLDF